ncbi:N-acetylglucosamine kinase [Mycetocola saprophilus]|uniref:N-acetylglucosamine kinase n=1 Tax=Mycetocola saprophilus TaxID=76636 RepID=UPI0004BED1E0|nr:BadF/BadG/BcrA/BcrD ATPase family protein [Mycetocola saprophilus]
MSALRIGLDIGGTKTALRAVDEHGVQVHNTVVSSGEWDAEPADPAAELILAVLSGIGVSAAEVLGLGVGAQGLDNPQVAADLEHALRARGLARVHCVNDAALLIPAAGVDAGIGLIAGTGAIGVGTLADGTAVSAGGWGWVIGDEAGGSGIVREATRAALLAHDDGLPDDGLLGALLASFGVADAERLARAVNDEPTMANWSPHAPAVFAAADAGSGLAAGVIDGAAAHLARLVDQLVRRGAVGAHVVAAGSVILGQPRLAEGVRKRVATAHPGLEFHLLEDDPVAGALALARAL